MLGPEVGLVDLGWAPIECKLKKNIVSNHTSSFHIEVTQMHYKCLYKQNLGRKW